MAKGSSSLLGTLIKLTLGLVVMLLLILVIAWFWFTRSISPVELSTEELREVEQKVQPVITALESGETPPSPLILTEREFNGFLHKHSKYGKTVQFEFEPDLIIAHVHEKAPKDAPVIGGKKIRARVEMEFYSESGKPVIKVISVSAFATSKPEEYLEKYMKRNIYSMLKEKLEVDYEVDCVENIEIRDGELEIDFYTR